MKTRKTWQPGLGGFLGVVPLVTPLCVAVITPLAPGASTFHLSPSSLVVAKYVLWAVVAYVLGSGFLIEWAIRRDSERLRSRGMDPNVFVLRTNVASVAVLPFGAFVLCLFGGRSSDVYILVLLSLVFGAFWCLRLRAAFQTARV